MICMMLYQYYLSICSLIYVCIRRDAYNNSGTICNHRAINYYWYSYLFYCNVPTNNRIVAIMLLFNVLALLTALI